MAANIHDVEAIRRARQQLPRSRERARLERARRALCEPARVQILKALLAEDLCVSDLAMVIDRPPETTSQHLRVLRELRAVEGERRGRTVHYRVSRQGRTTFAPLLDDVERRLTGSRGSG
jgi:ArsR family transcriptional regulator